jgi:hypothetical protein
MLRDFLWAVFATNCSGCGGTSTHDLMQVVSGCVAVVFHMLLLRVVSDREALIELG